MVITGPGVTGSAVAGSAIAGAATSSTAITLGPPISANSPVALTSIVTDAPFPLPRWCGLLGGSAWLAKLLHLWLR
jgi:hypothetical protein